MAPEATAQRLTVTNPNSFTSDEKRKTNPIRTHHRRPQKFFTTQRLPAFFAWTILLTTSFTYWICILPEILVLLPHLLPIPIIHCVLFVLVCANFVLATFMDPVSIFLHRSYERLIFKGIYQQSRKTESINSSTYPRSPQESENEDDDEPQSRLVRIRDGKFSFF